MNLDYDRKDGFFEVFYKFSKSVFLIFLIAAVLWLSPIILGPLLVHIISNFIENDYSYSRDTLRGINLKSIFMYLLVGLSVYVIVFVYINIPLLYTGVSASIIRGLNIFALFELMLLIMYCPKYSFYNQGSIIYSMKASLVLANLKIAVSLLSLIILAFITILLIVITQGRMLTLPVVLIFVWQLFASIVFRKISLSED